MILAKSFIKTYLERVVKSWWNANHANTIWPVKKSRCLLNRKL